MAINVQCACGKRTMVSDALAGKQMRCPGCGNEIPVVAAGTGKGKGKGKAGGTNVQATPKLEISSGQKILIGVVAVLIALGALFYFGPMRVWGQWSDMKANASQSVQDLVIFSLRQHMLEEDPDPRAHRRQPQVEEGDVHFFEPYLAFSLPDEVGFLGKSDQGTFSGNYNTKTHEVDADVSFGGYSVAGMVDVAKARGKYHLHGKMVNGKPEMEIDGKKVQ